MKEKKEQVRDGDDSWGDEDDDGKGDEDENIDDAEYFKREVSKAPELEFFDNKPKKSNDKFKKRTVNGRFREARWQ